MDGIVESDSFAWKLLGIDYLYYTTNEIIFPFIVCFNILLLKFEIDTIELAGGPGTMLNYIYNIF